MTLAELKAEIGANYNEEMTDNKLEGTLARAQAWLDYRACRQIDWETETQYQQLLVDCCKYMFSNSLAEFENEYAKELMAMYLDGLGESENET